MAGLYRIANSRISHSKRHNKKISQRRVKLRRKSKPLRRNTMQTNSSRVRMAGLVVVALGILAMTGFAFRHHQMAGANGRGLAASAAQPAANSADLANAYRRSALSFQQNEGQTDAQVRYMA